MWRCQQVVQRIKLRPDETELLVVDDETDEYYANLGLTIKGSQSNVIRKKNSPPVVETVRKMSISSDSESDHLANNSTQQQLYTNGQRRESNSSEEVKHVTRNYSRQ